MGAKRTVAELNEPLCLRLTIRLLSVAISDHQ